MEIYRKHWTPKHAFKAGDRVLVSDNLTQSNTPGRITRASPFNAWIAVQLLEGPFSMSHPLVVHMAGLALDNTIEEG